MIVRRGPVLSVSIFFRGCFTTAIPQDDPSVDITWIWIVQVLCDSNISRMELSNLEYSCRPKLYNFGFRYGMNMHAYTSITIGRDAIIPYPLSCWIYWATWKHIVFSTRTESWCVAGCWNPSLWIARTRLEIPRLLITWPFAPGPDRMVFSQCSSRRVNT